LCHEVVLDHRLGGKPKEGITGRERWRMRENEKNKKIIIF
jgi:hypothetical protein